VEHKLHRETEAHKSVSKVKEGGVKGLETAVPQQVYLNVIIKLAVILDDVQP